MKAPTVFEITCYSPSDIDNLLDGIVDLYEQAYVEPPYNGGPLFGRERFLERTNRQKNAEGFALVTASAASGLAGFTFGFTFGAGRWWKGTTTPDPPTAIVETPKFAVIELVVHKQFRGHGLGRALITSLLANRHEPLAMLLAEPDAPARRIYEHWGWVYIADVRPSEDAPLLHALVLDLSTQESERVGKRSN